MRRKSLLIQAHRHRTYSYLHFLTQDRQTYCGICKCRNSAIAISDLSGDGQGLRRRNAQERTFGRLSLRDRSPDKAAAGDSSTGADARAEPSTSPRHRAARPRQFGATSATRRQRSLTKSTILRTGISWRRRRSGATDSAPWLCGRRSGAVSPRISQRGVRRRIAPPSASTRSRQIVARATVLPRKRMANIRSASLQCASAPARPAEAKLSAEEFQSGIGAPNSQRLAAAQLFDALDLVSFATNTRCDAASA